MKNISIFFCFLTSIKAFCAQTPDDLGLQLRGSLTPGGTETDFYTPRTVSASSQTAVPIGSEDMGGNVIVPRTRRRGCVVFLWGSLIAIGAIECPLVFKFLPKPAAAIILIGSVAIVCLGYCPRK